MANRVPSSAPRAGAPVSHQLSLADLVRQLQQAGHINDASFTAQFGALARDILLNGRNCAQSDAQISEFIIWCTGQRKPEIFGPLLNKVLTQWGLSKLNYAHRMDLFNAGAKLIAHALKDGLQCHSLRLSGCRIGNDGAAEIAQALTGNQTLKTLILDCNALDRDCVPSLLAVIRDCALTELSLGNTLIDPLGQRQICEAWREAGKLQWPEPTFKGNCPRLHMGAVMDILRKAGLWGEKTTGWVGCRESSKIPVYYAPYEQALTESLHRFARNGQLPKDDTEIMRLATLINQFLPECRDWMHGALQAADVTQLTITLPHDDIHPGRELEWLGNWLGSNPPLRDLTIFLPWLEESHAASFVAGLKQNHVLGALYIVQTERSKNHPGRAKQFAELFPANRTLQTLDVSCVRELDPRNGTPKQSWPYDTDSNAVKTIEDGLEKNRLQSCRIESALCMQAIGLPNELSDQVLNQIRWISLGSTDGKDWRNQAL